MSYVVNCVEFRDRLEDCYRNSASKGFWSGQDPQNIDVALSKLALIHSEVSEACEGLRNGIDDDASGGLGEELADVVIRCFDLAVAREVNLIDHIMHKTAKNAKRPHKHGGKLA